MFRVQRRKIADSEARMVMRRAHRAQHEAAVGPCVGAVALRARDLGERHRPGPGGRRRPCRPPVRPMAPAGAGTARPRRSCDSRCSGRARRRAHPAPRASVGAGLRASRSSAAISMPGVQMPHWAAPWARNACCSALMPAPFVRPSTVTTARPCACAAATMQAQTWRPSSRTVQAPQSPALQPTLVPVSPRSSRSTSASRRTGSTWTSTRRPLSGERDLLRGRSHAISPVIARRTRVSAASRR